MRFEVLDNDSVFAPIIATLQPYHIHLTITRKRVKNVNFSIKPNLLMVSAPMHVSNLKLADIVKKRLSWVIKSHAKIIAQQKTSNHISPNQPTPLVLWGEIQELKMNESQRLTCYRNELKQVMPKMFAKWQPIVGKTAKETRIKKMKTRWGSCNVQAKRIWLSVYLPKFPIECTEYVIVHELCHLHHANHSTKFWHEVSRAMPNYISWHQMLAGKNGTVD